MGILKYFNDLNAQYFEKSQVNIIKIFFIEKKKPFLMWYEKYEY